MKIVVAGALLKGVPPVIQWVGSAIIIRMWWVLSVMLRIPPASNRVLGIAPHCTSSFCKEKCPRGFQLSISVLVVAVNGALKSKGNRYESTHTNNTTYNLQLTIYHSLLTTYIVKSNSER